MGRRRDMTQTTTRVWPEASLRPEPNPLEQFCQGLGCEPLDEGQSSGAFVNSVRQVLGALVEEHRNPVSRTIRNWDAFVDFNLERALLDYEKTVKPIKDRIADTHRRLTELGQRMDQYRAERPDLALNGV